MMKAGRGTTCNDMIVTSEWHVHDIETSQNQGCPLSKENILNKGTPVVTPGEVAVKMRVPTSEKPREK